MSGVDAAGYCGVTPETFSRWVAAGTLPKAVIGRRWDRKALGEAMARLDVRPQFPTMSKVYFIESGDFIKIGVSGSPELRLKSLQTSSPNELKILATISGTDVEEKRIHHLFDQDRQQGEWFSKTPALTLYIEWLNGRPA